MRKVQIKLFNAGDGLLDTHAVDVPEGIDEEQLLQESVTTAIASWTLAVGDTIKIEEV
jgi:hypothetical protein